MILSDNAGVMLEAPASGSVEINGSEKLISDTSTSALSAVLTRRSELFRTATFERLKAGNPAAPEEPSEGACASSASTACSASALLSSLAVSCTRRPSIVTASSTGAMRVRLEMLASSTARSSSSMWLPGRSAESMLRFSNVSVQFQGLNEISPTVVVRPLSASGRTLPTAQRTPAGTPM